MPDARTHPHTAMPSEAQLAQLILQTHPQHHKLYLAAHRLVLETVPELTYSVDRVDSVIGYGARQFGYDGWGMAALSPHKGWVSLFFFRGAELDDPEGRPDGSGALLRHVKLRSLEDLAARRQYLARLLKAAVGIT